MKRSQSCHVCGGAISELRGFPVAIQVTSDCRPWKGNGRLAACSNCGTLQKVISDEWLAEMPELYAGYSMYEQGGGSEQVSFDGMSGAATARSRKIVDWLCAGGNLPLEGKLLDIGCGNGAFMRAFGVSHPRWRMTGLELDARNQAAIAAIPGAVELQVGDLDSVHGHFELIVLVHALEHMAHPAQYLRELRGKLAPGGMLLIEVPDVERSPFDILIADHCTHFSTGTLSSIVNMAGLEIVSSQAGHVPKELTLLARQAASQTTTALVTDGIGDEVTANKTIAWLQAVLNQARSVEAPVGIFGTSISATWLAGALGGAVTFFVDEDGNRIGRRHMDLPIYGPGNAPKELPILMPLRADIAASVRARLSDSQLYLVPPPAG